MERIELVKEIGNIEIESLLQIGVDENVRYLKKEDGINVVGCIDINGIYLKYDNSNCTIKESIDVDMNILYENIQDSEKFRLYIEDFSYEIIDGKLILKIFVKFDSYRDIMTTFPSLEVVECEPLVNIDIEKSKEEQTVKIEREQRESVPFLRSYFKSDSYDKSISLYVLKENESLEDVSLKLGIDLSLIKNLNDGVECKKGNLIKIPLHDR